MKLKITDSELYCVVFLLLISIFYSCKAFAGNCPAEPTQMSVPYGERITCEINPESDTDVFYFSGTKGDRVVATLDRISGEDFRPIMKMYAPDGEYLDYSFTKIDKSLPKTGIYSVTVNDNSQNYSGQYAFGVSCLGGNCLPNGNFDCSGATLSSADLSIHIPVLNMQTSNGNVPIWVDFSYQQHLKDGIYFKVLNYGIAK